MQAAQTLQTFVGFLMCIASGVCMFHTTQDMKVDRPSKVLEVHDECMCKWINETGECNYCYFLSAHARSHVGPDLFSH